MRPTFTKRIEVTLLRSECPDDLASHMELWFGNVLRIAGIPLFGRSLVEGVAKGNLDRAESPDGRVTFLWTDEGVVR